MDMLFIKGALAKEKVKGCISDFLHKESGEVNVVAIIVLIAVAIAIALVFKEQLETLVTTLFGNLTSNGTDAIDGLKK